MIYFFDEAGVAVAHNLEPVPGPVEKLGTGLEPDRPSDGKRCMSFASSIMPLEDGRWRMYYSVSDFAANLKSIAMAESADGLHWEKPMLGQVQVDGRDTNRLDIKGLAEGVEVERCTQPQVCQVDGGRWRMFFWVNHRPFLRYLMAESSDGLHWEVSDFERPIIYHPLELGAWIWTPGVLPPVEVQDRGPDQETLGRFVPGEEAQWGHLLERLDADELVRLKGLRANDAVYVYRDVEHGQYELYAPWPMCNIEGCPRRWEDDNAPFMGLATAADGIGRLWTRPFVLSSTELCVDARLDGCLRAELCDPFGKTLPGFESDRCQLVSGDRVDHVLRWEGAAVAPYQYNAVSLRLEVERGAIYNIHWRRDAT